MVKTALIYSIVTIYLGLRPRIKQSQVIRVDAKYRQIAFPAIGSGTLAKDFGGTTIWTLWSMVTDEI